MLTTAKSIQLLDVSGMNISPITDITSLYYEVQHSQNDNIITRKYVYDGFPVFVNISNDEIPQIGVARTTSERHPSDGPLYDDGQFYKLINKTSGSDILVSNVSTDIVPGTTLRQINITNYNLSKILSYYTPLDLMDASINALDISIDNINSSIRDVSTRIHDFRKSLDASNCSLSEIVNWSINNALVSNKFYLINDYYVSQGSDGCMALPIPSTNFSGPTSDNSLSLLVKANDSANLDGKLYEMYDRSGNALKVYGTYKLSGESGAKPLIQITYMKDQYGNEAPYDLYNLRYNNKFTFNKDDDNSNLLLLFNDTIKNNIIKTDPYSFYSMPKIQLLSSNNKINNNYFGYNSSICIINERYSTCFITNNIIGNNSSIYFFGGSMILCDNKISNNNIINQESQKLVSISNMNVNNYNNISVSSNIISNLNINSSNNITLYNNASNVTILNNCDGSINLSDNIIVDNYIDTATNSSLNTTPNSVYLFKQDVYAKSFNTLK